MLLAVNSNNKSAIKFEKKAICKKQANFNQNKATRKS